MTHATDLTDAQFALVEPLVPATRTGGRPRSTDLRRALDAVPYRLRTGFLRHAREHGFAGT